MKHRTFWAIFILGVLILSGFAGFSTLAAGAPWTSATVRGPPSNVVVAHTLPRDALVVGAPVLEVAATSLTAVALTWTAPANVSVLNYTLYRGTAYASPLTGTPVSESTSLSATVSALSPNTTYYFEVGTWTGATTRGPYSSIAPVHTLAVVVPPPPAPIIPVSLTIPQVVVISTFMALIVAGLIAAGTRKKKRNRNGYPMSD
jgi:hypothetical protein